MGRDTLIKKINELLQLLYHHDKADTKKAWKKFFDETEWDDDDPMELLEWVFNEGYEAARYQAEQDFYIVFGESP